MSALEDMTAIVEHLTQWRRFLAVYPGVVTNVAGEEVDVVCDDESMRGQGHTVRFVGGSAAGGGMPVVGDRVLLAFEAGDPARPIAWSCTPVAAFGEVAAIASKTQANLDAVSNALSAHTHTVSGAATTATLVAPPVVFQDIESDFPVRTP